MNFNANTPKSQRPPLRGDLQIKYDRARANLLLVAIVSIINLFTLAFNYTYFLFSASLPALPVELALPMSEEEVVATSDMILPIVIGIVLTVPYLLCWLFSKKHPGWMVAALAFFSLDCLYLLFLASFDPLAVLLDILFHAWVMFYLITGVINGFKLKDMPEEQPLPEIGADSPIGDTPSADPFGTFNQADFNHNAPNTDAERTEDRGDAFVAKEDKE